MKTNRFYPIVAVLVLISSVAFAGGGHESAATGQPLTYWMPLGDKASQVLKDNSEILAMQEISKNTGVEVTFLHPAVGQEPDQFNLMIASGDIPDMVFWKNDNIAENLDLFMPITDKLEKYAPYYYDEIQDDRIRKPITMDDGEIYFFASMRVDPSIRVWMGPAVRGDWLDALGLGLPETIADWHAMLTAFKQNDMNGNGDPNDEIPFVSRNEGGYSFMNFAAAWGLVTFEFYVDGNTVHFSPFESVYQDFVAEMHKWYAEGLLDKDWAATDGNSFKAKLAGDVGGSMFGSLIGIMGTYNTLLKDGNPSHHFVGTPWVKSELDGVAYNPRPDHAMIVQPYSAVISRNASDWEAAMRYLDYGYGDEGYRIMNFGIEGVSYTMQNGTPVFTDEVLHNPDGLAFGEALAKYAMTANTMAAFIQDPNEFAQASLATPEQADANALWAAGDQSRLLPSVTYSNQERAELNDIMGDVTTYVWEMTTQFVMGLRGLDEFPDFYRTLKNMGIENAIAIQQSALDRYNSK